MQRLKLSTLRSGQEVNNAKLYKKAAFSVYSAVSSARACDEKSRLKPQSNILTDVDDAPGVSTLRNRLINDLNVAIIEWSG